MDSKSRIDYFSKLTESEPYSYKDIYYKGKPRKLPVYQIDLDYLIYNVHNGRIASLVKSYEKERGIEIDPTHPEDVTIIEGFLNASSAAANKKTKETLSDGQKEYGIVTKDGVVVDGNRRTMLLREVYKEKRVKPGYFLGVVLEEYLEDNKREIMRLETTYQMGEDSKVDYNPIEKYLKCKDMTAAGFDSAEIGKSMGETPTKIKEYISIMKLMDRYLEQLNYDGIYTRLNKTEDLFINLNKVLSKWEKSTGKIKDWNPSKSDLSEYKLICFDYIRYAYNSPPKSRDAKEIRDKLSRNSEDTFFASKNVWKGFSGRHAKTVGTISINEKSVDDYKAENPGKSLSDLYKAKDEAWASSIHDSVEENFGKANESLENIKISEKPAKLLSGAFDKLKTIDTTSNAFLLDENVYTLVDAIRKLSDDYKKQLIDFKKHN